MAKFTEEDAIVIADAIVGKWPKLQAACALRAKLNDLIQQADDDANSPYATTADIERKRTRINAAAAECATCEHSCAHHNPAMNPRIWSTLPKELLQLVFARLPLYETFRLCSLSKEWNQSIFGRVASEAQGKMFALISSRALLSMHLYDIKSRRWHKVHLSSPNRVPYQAISSDGGLVCFIARQVGAPIMVCNPVTRAWRELPRHALSMMLPNMVQLVMNRETKRYKVIMVARRGDDKVLHAMIYESATGLWSCTNLFSDLVYRNWHYWTDPDGDEAPIAEIEDPCVYDCRRGRRFLVGADGKAICVRLVRDRRFLLYKSPAGELLISECQASGKGKFKEVPLRVYSCKTSAECSDYEMELFACEGILLVSMNNGLMDAFRHELLCVCDLDTREWHEPVAPPESCFIASEDDVIMCELKWDAVP